jgi:hypothetical protein
MVQMIGNRLPGWKRRCFSYPGRETLVKSVLSSLPTFFLTVFKMPKWAFLQMDKFRRGFLWKGKEADKVKGGHCLVNWKTCTMPRRWGGLGIKDFEKFSRALRLRWLWLRWETQGRPWKPSADPTNRQLFFCSTVITIGNGKNTPFWEARWLNGLAPKELPSNLFKAARFKSRSVHTELKNSNWIRNLQDINTFELLEEFTMLFLALNPVTLSQENDSIKWNWTPDGRYSVASTYECQFLGSFSKFPAPEIWKASSDPKAKFFAWLVMHNRVLTAENMLTKNWSCNPICSLCTCMDETTPHSDTLIWQPCCVSRT